MAYSIKTVLARVPQFTGKSTSHTPLEGGITNQNYKVDVDDAAYVVRIGGENTEVHGIHRPTEFKCAQAAFKTGIAPEIIAFLPEENVFVTQFITGRTLTDADIRRPDTLRQIVQLMKRYHAIKDFAGHFSVFDISQSYLTLATEFGSPLPDNISDIFALAQRFETALSQHQEPLVACHNDLLAANFIDDGERLWLLDWEYAGWGDRFFDLANLSVNNGFSDKEDHLLLTSYFGQYSRSTRARLKLTRILSDLREGLWGMVQWAVATLDFDYENYGLQHLERFNQAGRSPQIERWLEEV
ncbi:MAG: phosphotransferase family protein [bacterium]|nr:phosphotransferase family protein [bacterium]